MYKHNLNIHLFFLKFPNITSIAEVPCYVLLLSGERDLVYPGVQLLFVFLSDRVPHFILQLLLGRHSYDLKVWLI